jgi:hypothetical protein
MPNKGFNGWLACLNVVVPGLPDWDPREFFYALMAINYIGFREIR